MGTGGGGSSQGCCCGRKKRQADSPDTKFFNLGGSGCTCNGVGRRKRQSENKKFFNFGSYNSCQCSRLTSSAGGNCSRDNTGRRWCYTTGWNSGCRDLVSSSKYPNNPWSYQACDNQYGK